MKDLELVVDAKATLGEGPCWDREKQVLYWVDIFGQNVHIYDPKANVTKTIQTPQYVGAVVPRNSKELLLAMHHGFYSLDIETETFTPIADPEEEIATNRFNDGKLDAKGRFWAGTMDMEEVRASGSLYCLEPDFSVRKVLDGITVSNGLDWDLDKGIFYYIDTPTRQVAAFDYDIETGSLSNRRTVIHFPDGEGFPDGMTIDKDGMLWIAHWEGAQVSRWNPNTGKKVDAISVPALRVTSCAFGGEDLRDLYITTARINMSEADLEKYPHAGGLFKVTL